jgi:hypothetical protein
MNDNIMNMDSERAYKFRISANAIHANAREANDL